MPIIMFQAFIILTMFASRSISDKALTICAICWSIFTLIMVFMPWLMAFQLIIVWVAYSKLRRDVKH